MGSLRNEIGNRYGRLSVIERAPVTGGGAHWICSCDCGEMAVVYGSNLRTGHTRSCGCLGEDLAADEAGNRYGRLTVVERAGSNRHGSALWRCICECGQETIVIGKDLRSERTQSCGCLQRDRVAESNRLPEGRAATNALFWLRRSQARQAGRAWKLTMAEFDDLTSQPCHYCGAAPSQTFTSPRLNGDYIYNGLDRIDNKRGYVLDNIVTCCFVCNRAKNNMGIEEFFEWIKQVFNHSIRRKCKNGDERS